jgi:hypothetical protein
MALSRITYDAYSKKLFSNKFLMKAMAAWYHNVPARVERGRPRPSLQAPPLPALFVVHKKLFKDSYRLLQGPRPLAAKGWQFPAMYFWVQF